MASATPIAIGTRGTVGALVRKEIEYFTKLELDRRARPRRGGGPSQHGHHHHHQPNWHSLRFLAMTWNKKKKHASHRANGAAAAEATMTTRTFLPTLCSVSDVSEVNRLNGIPGFGYRALTDDVDYNLEL